MSDASSIIVWWLTILVIGSIFVPVTFSLFHRLPDKGYIFSKVIGILLSSYFIWILGSLRLLPFSRLTIIIVLIGFTLLNLYLSRNRFTGNSQLTTHNLQPNRFPWRFILLEESLFLLTLSFWSYIRANEPSIHSLEKFMDFGFVNSILRTNFFPPLDMWLTKSPDYSGGYFINYYYYGHYINAFLTKLSGLPSPITYNLMIATLFAFTFTLPFSIGVNLAFFLHFAKNHFPKINSSYLQLSPKRTPYISINKMKLLVAGLMAAFIVSLGGNLHTIYTFTAGYPNESPEPFWKLAAGYHPERYWYPNATRFIPFTIHEFPIYSFVVADLHGHVSDIPMVFLVIILLFSLVIEKKKADTPPPENTFKPSQLAGFLSDFENHTSIPFLKLAFLGVILAIMYMTNAWDGLIYMVLCGLVFLYLNLRKKIEEPTISLFSLIYKTFSASLFLLFFFLVISLPFSLNFRPFVSGVGILCAPKFLLEKKLGPFLFETDKCQKSPLWMMMVLWGFFYFNVIGYFILVLIPTLRNKFQTPSTKSQINLKFKAPNPKQKNIFTSLKIGILNLFENCKLKIGNLTPIDIFILILIFLSTLLLIFPEFAYIKDIYPAHYRANTMFKLGYQAFMMLGIVSTYVIFRIIQSGIKGLKISIFYLLFSILFFLVAIYPYFAINSYYGNLQKYYGLDGLAWMASQYPDDYNAVNWLNSNITCADGDTSCDKQPVIVEANGDSYTDYDRVSANTGLLTIVGWPVHEWLWRGSYDEAGKRIPDVAAIYESTDVEKTKEILRKYNAEYIFIGALEKQKYPALNEEKLLGMGKVVFESGQTKIVKVGMMNSL